MKVASHQPRRRTSPMTRRLQTFGSPDLEVTVGKNERMYHYHALLLASQSSYVDMILSSPANKQKDKWRISFPDIEVETWELMMKYLRPAEDFASLDDLLETIPFYDKYQFTDGLGYCDVVLSKRMPNAKDHPCLGNYPTMCKLITLIFELSFFPKSKPLAVEWAKYCMSTFIFLNDGDMIHSFLPLVENDENIVKAMMSTFLGKRCKTMSMNEMRDVIKQPDFPSQVILRCTQIKEIDEQLVHLTVGSLDIYSCSVNEVNGSYKYEICSPSCHYNKDYAGSHRGGATLGIWKRAPSGFEERHYGDITIESVDVFGSVWEVYSHTWIEDDDNADEVDRKKTTLLRWENGIFNSLIPPRVGWKIIDEIEDADHQSAMRINYSISSRAY